MFGIDNSDERILCALSRRDDERHSIPLFRCTARAGLHKIGAKIRFGDDFGGREAKMNVGVRLRTPESDRGKNGKAFSPQHQARSRGTSSSSRVTVHGGAQPAAGVEDVCLADLGLAHGFLGNVIPFRRLEASQTATPDCVVSLETRPVPLLPRLSPRGFWLALAVTVAAHAAAFAVFLGEPLPLASIGVEVVSVESWSATTGWPAMAR